MLTNLAELLKDNQDESIAVGSSQLIEFVGVSLVLHLRHANV